ncbi:DUF6731 family protein [Amycolatopsis sp. cg13]|uniref:DUF6731 family protein n=1 Tax=Amycolatopsis sp. cg13 TaxID=3238807 RepID=UPI00352512B9
MPSQNASQQRDLVKERRIYFFAIDAGANKQGEPNKIDLSPILRKIGEMPFSLKSRRYQQVGNSGDLLCTWVDSTEYPLKFKFAAIRRNALPQSELEGQLRDLVLADNEGICESSHVCVFEDGIIGIENNFYGPRPSRLAGYLLSAGSSAVSDFVLESLIRGDAARQLLNKKEIRAIELRIRSPYAEVISELDETLGQALKSIASAGNAETVSIVLRPGPYRKVNLNPRFIPLLRRLLGREDLRENTLRMTATLLDPETRKPGEVNLLDDKLVSTRKILRANRRTRVLDSSDAYEKIVDAYNELHDDLVSAYKTTISSISAADPAEVQ